MQCPKGCETTLERETVESIEVDRCSHCHGVWFDEDELPQLLSVPRSSLSLLAKGKFRPAVDATVGTCPKDGTQLVRAYSKADRNTTIERCPECHGAWLDGGELRRLLDAN